MQDDTNLTKSEQHRLVWRLVAAILTSLFGCMWIAMYFAKDLAPPEPEIATRLRFISQYAFLATLIWSAKLYYDYLHSNKRKP